MENKRLALNIGVTLSGNLISACLAMLAILAAVFTFIIEKRIIGFTFYFFIILSFFLFIFSIILGGKGINKVRQKAFNGTLDLNCSKKQFNWQAITCLLGLIFFTASIFFTSSKNDRNIELEKISQTLNKFLEIEKNKNLQIEQLQNQIDMLEVRIKKIEQKK